MTTKSVVTSRSALIIILLIICCSACMEQPATVKRPKLVVGIVVDQMRWDYLYRYYERYGRGGFKRLMHDGYSCQQTMVNYLPTYTAPGHTCVYTGSVPSIHGIAGNDWINNQTGKKWYCTEDTAVWLAGDEKREPSMSPANMLVTTVTDELRMATNFRSRVYGVALKDRGAILPAGHTANAAYWYNEKTGNFVTSTYYAKEFQNPEWLSAFNKRNVVDSLTRQDWELMYDIKSYAQSTKDATPYEGAFKGEAEPVFPHKISTMPKADRLSIIKSLPAGNTLTMDMARACIEGAAGGKLGSGKDVDFLCLSLSSTDYIGHRFAPNSIEVEDAYLRLDREIASFLEYLDRTVGEGNYLMFLTADHAGAHNPQFLKDHGVPAGIWADMTRELNGYLSERYASDSPLVRSIMNYQVFLNEGVLAGDKTIRELVKTSARDWLANVMPAIYHVPVSYVLDMEDMGKQAVPELIKSMAVNGYNRNRSGGLQVVLDPGWFESEHQTGTTHGSWNPYDAHIPLLWYGWHIPKGETHTVVNMTDIAPTMAALLHIQMPSGCIGKPITDLIK